MLIEFPADDPARALRFWEGVLGRPLAPRTDDQGEGWQTGDGGGGRRHPCRAPRDRATGSPSPISTCDDVDAAVARVEELGGSVIHRGERWTICRDSEGSPFGLGPLP